MLPSLHSQTSGLTVEVLRPMAGLAAMARRISASVQAATPKVLVRRIGVSMVPSSATCIRPADLPKPLITSTAARGFTRKRSPGCGTMAVTPVKMPSPRSERCPTVTPGTSVIALSGPTVSRLSGISPSSRAVFIPILRPLRFPYDGTPAASR